MKIEIGESLVRSWLRHIECCQVAELNWKSSPKWLTDVKAQSLMDDARRHFQKALAVDIFGGTHSVTQLVRQGEIDVLGLQIDSDGKVSKIYAVDMAFHEKGLNYGGNLETSVRICKKLVRSAIIVKSYFGPTPTKLIFASPNIGQKYLDQLKVAMGELDIFFRASKLDCEAELITNEAFLTQILEPTIHAGDEVADTSELFLRSLQLVSLFKPFQAHSKVTPVTAPPSVQVSNSTGPLPIELEPSNVSEFGQRLLETKAAVISIFYKNGTNEERAWNAEKFTVSSDVIGNLRSRPQFRQGEWQKRGISHVKVKIAG
ncbi:MAG: hypothetical protein HC883_06100 [Bdellovibrionaceae bacterium]|nr:hypothetical protein [Pseudobdellovibrionaceae bacterium]